jgi:hypothetical protein
MKCQQFLNKKWNDGEWKNHEVSAPEYRRLVLKPYACLL